MSQDVAIKAETSIYPPPLPRGLTSLISERRDGIDAWILRRPLSEAERSGLSNEIEAVERKLAPADDEKRRKILARMLLTFKGKGDGRDELAAYMFATRSFPYWAIEEACGRIISGDVIRESHEFAPKAPTVANIIKELVQPWRYRLWELRKVLTAEAPSVIDNAELKRNAQRVTELLNVFGGKIDGKI